MVGAVVVGSVVVGSVVVGFAFVGFAFVGFAFVGLIVVGLVVVPPPHNGFAKSPHAPPTQTQELHSVCSHAAAPPGVICPVGVHKRGGLSPKHTNVVTFPIHSASEVHTGGGLQALLQAFSVGKPQTSPVEIGLQPPIAEAQASEDEDHGGIMVGLIVVGATSPLCP